MIIIIISTILPKVSVSLNKLALDAIICNVPVHEWFNYYLTSSCYYYGFVGEYCNPNITLPADLLLKKISNSCWCFLPSKRFINLN